MTTNLKAELKQALTRPLIQYLFLFLAVLCVYLPTLWYTFIWDDWDMIGHNLVLRDWRNIPLFFTDASTFVHVRPNTQSMVFAWRPMRNVYWVFTYILYDLRPAGWHLNQILLHGLCTILLLVFVRRIFHLFAPHSRHTLLATWIAVLCWAVHPVNTEVVAWVKTADDILACIFGLATLIILLPRDGRITFPRIAIAALLYPIGLLAKESLPPIAAIYPVIILLLAGGIRAAFKNRMAIIASAVLVVETLVYIVIRHQVLGQTSQGDYLTDSFSLMMATMTTGWVRYLQLIIWPFWPTTQSTTYYDWPYATSWTDTSVLVSLSIIFAAVIIAILIARRSRIAACGFAFFCFAVLPVANLVPMLQVLAERFLYFPLMGLVLVLAAGLQWAFSRPRLATAAHTLAIAVPVALIITTELRLPTWAVEETFLEAQLKAYPNDGRALINMAITHRNAGNFDEALRYFRKVTSTKTRDINDHYLAHIAIGQILMTEGKTTPALQHVNTAQRLRPEEPMAYKVKGGMYLALDQTTAALQAYESAKTRSRRFDHQLESRMALAKQRLEGTTTTKSMP